MKRLITPSLNMPGLIAAALAIYAVIQGAYNSAHGSTVLTSSVIVAAISAALSAYARTQVTPVADPRDGNGTPLLTANAHAAENFRRSLVAGQYATPSTLEVPAPSPAGTVPPASTTGPTA